MMTKIRKRVVSGILAAVTLFAAIRPEIPLFASPPKNTQTFTYSDENITIEAEIGKSTVFTAGEDVYITEIVASGSAVEVIDETASGSAVTAETKPRTVSISKDDVASGGALAVTEEKTYNIDDVELYVEVLDETDERFADIELEEGQGIKLLDIGFKTQDGEIVKADLQNAKISYTINTPEEAESVDDVQVYMLTDTEQPTATITEDSETVVEEITDIETKQKENTVTFETDSLAPIAVVYTVDFYFGDYEYHLGGGESILLSRLFGLLGIVEDVSNVIDVTFSNPDLVKVERVGFNWFLTSLQPFDTEEKLNVTFKNGEVIEIRVTDAQACTINYVINTGILDKDTGTATLTRSSETVGQGETAQGPGLSITNGKFLCWVELVDGKPMYTSSDINFIPTNSQLKSTTYVAIVYANNKSRFLVCQSDYNSGQLNSSGATLYNSQISWVSSGTSRYSAIVTDADKWTIDHWEKNGEIYTDTTTTPVQSATFGNRGNRTNNTINLTTSNQTDGAVYMVVYRPVGGYIITYKTDGNGTVTRATDYTTEADFVGAKAEPNSGYSFVGWYIDGNCISENDELTYSDISGLGIAANTTVTAKFEKLIRINYSTTNSDMGYTGTGTISKAYEYVQPGSDASGCEVKSGNFVCWVDDDWNVVGYSSEFVPTNGQLIDGANYYAVFNSGTGFMLAVNDSSLARITFTNNQNNAFNNESYNVTGKRRVWEDQQVYLWGEDQVRLATTSSTAFVRWEIDGKEVSKVIDAKVGSAGSNIVVADNKVLKLIVKPKNTFIVNYICATGGNINNTTDYASSTTAKGCTATPAGTNDFMGWYINGTRVSESLTITADDLITWKNEGKINADFTEIEAKFGKGKVVTFNTQLDDETPDFWETETVTSTLSDREPKVISDDYYFIGWYNEDGTLITENNKLTSEDVTVTDGKVIIAKYKRYHQIFASVNDTARGTVSAEALNINLDGTLSSDLIATLTETTHAYFDHWRVVSGDGYKLKDASDEAPFIKSNIESLTISKEDYVFAPNTKLEAVFSLNPNTLQIKYNMTWNEKDNPSYPIKLRIYGSGEENTTTPYFTGDTESLTLEKAIEKYGDEIPKESPNVSEYVTYSYNEDNSIKFSKYVGCQAIDVVEGGLNFSVSCWYGGGEVIIEEIEHYVPASKLLEDAVKAGSDTIVFTADGRRDVNTYILPQEPINGHIEFHGSSTKSTVYDIHYLMNTSYETQTPSPKAQTVTLYSYTAVPDEGYTFYAWEYNGKLIFQSDIEAAATEVADYKSTHTEMTFDVRDTDYYATGDYENAWKSLNNYFLVDHPNVVNLLKAHFVPEKPYATFNYKVSDDTTYCADNFTGLPSEEIVDGTTKKALTVTPIISHYSLKSSDDDENVEEDDDTSEGDSEEGKLGSTATVWSPSWAFYYWIDSDTGEIVSYDRYFEPDLEAVKAKYETLKPDYVQEKSDRVATALTTLREQYENDKKTYEEEHADIAGEPVYADYLDNLLKKYERDTAAETERISNEVDEELQEMLIYNYEAVFGTKYNIPVQYKTENAEIGLVTDGINGNNKNELYNEDVDSESTAANGSRAEVITTDSHNEFLNWTIRKYKKLGDEITYEDVVVSTNEKFVPRIDQLRVYMADPLTDEDGAEYYYVTEDNIPYYLHKKAITITDEEENEYTYLTLEEPYRITFTAHYVHVNNLIIRKFVEGNLGSKDQYFEMNVKLSGLTPNKKYSVDMSNANGIIEAKPNAATSCINTAFEFPNDKKTDAGGTKYNDYYILADGEGNAEQIFYLQDGQSITIKGLPDDTSADNAILYKVKEDAEDYKSTTKITGEDSAFNGSNDEPDADGYYTINKNDNQHITVSFTNKKSGILPTGTSVVSLILTLSTLFGIFGIVFLQIKKKKIQFVTDVS